MKTIQLFFLFATACSAFSAIITRTGNYWETFGSADPFRNTSTTGTERVKNITLIFPAFTSVPKVGVAIRGFETPFNNSGIKVKVVAVNTTSFTFQLVAPKNSSVNVVSIYWIATISDAINIANYEVTNPKVIAGTKPYVSGKVKFKNVTTGNITTIALLSGFQFVNASTAVLDATISNATNTSASIRTFVNVVNRPSYLNVLVIQYNNASYGSLALNSKVNVGMARGTGARWEVIKYPMPIRRYLTFDALSGFSFNGNHLRRIWLNTTMTNSTNLTYFNANFSTAGDSQVNWAKGQLLFN